MKKYWIIENGKPVGPFTTSELRVRRDFTRDLPVWYSELPAWTTVGQVPELASLLEEQAAESVHQPVQPQQTQQGGVFSSSAWTRMESNPQPAMAYGEEKRPSSYMGWFIFATLCCCLPLGIVGLILSYMVNRKWIKGDIEGAKKYSEYAAWCLILAFTLGIVSIPFQIVYML